MADAAKEPLLAADAPAGSTRKTAPGAVEEETMYEKFQHLLGLGATAMMLLTYILVAFAFFGPVEGFFPVETLYYVMVTLTTVGYGDFKPLTTGGQFFTTGCPL